MAKKIKRRQFLAGVAAAPPLGLPRLPRLRSPNRAAPRPSHSPPLPARTAR